MRSLSHLFGEIEEQIEIAVWFVAARDRCTVYPLQDRKYLHCHCYWSDRTETDFELQKYTANFEFGEVLWSPSWTTRSFSQKQNFVLAARCFAVASQHHSEFIIESFPSPRVFQSTISASFWSIKFSLKFILNIETNFRCFGSIKMKLPGFFSFATLSTVTIVCLASIRPLSDVIATQRIMIVGFFSSPTLVSFACVYLSKKIDPFSLSLKTPLIGFSVTLCFRE